MMSDSAGPILIVDDSLTVRMDLSEAFSDAGLETKLCSTASEARAAIEEAAPPLIVLDVILPDADGVDLLTELRRSEATARLPIILLSSEAEVRDRIRGLSEGADEYVGKPYDARYVVARASALLRNSARAETPARILVIDDSLTFRETLGTLLRDAGYEAILVSSGHEGLRRAANTRPDAVIVDGVMPDLDGPAVVRRLRLDPALHTTPCLLLTASEGAASEVLALDAGADAYVRKAEDTKVVLARLAAMLRTAEESRQESAAAAGLLGPQRILAVDDSLTHLEELAEELRAEGYEVVKARSGEDALELLSVEQIDCILLDLLMPGLSGTETCRRVKGSPLLRNIPLIMLTALEEPEAMIEGINAGADDYVAKSAAFDVLKARVRAQLRRKQFEDENRRVRDRLLHQQAETRAARETSKARAELLQRLEAKNSELELLNKELKMFAYSVSHDLRHPLRSMDGFSKVLLDDYGDQLDERGRHYLERVRAGAQRMGQLIDGLLTLSRVTRKEIRPEQIDLATLSREVLQRLADSDPERSVEVELPESLPETGDAQLMESVLENLLSNAWKFTSKETRARIEIGREAGATPPVYYVRDNGVGFKMEYAENLFGPFQRLHPEREFPGTGIGLATVQRIIVRHGGRLWAQSSPGEGATFYFTLDSRGEETA